MGGWVHRHQPQIAKTSYLFDHILVHDYIVRAVPASGARLTCGCCQADKIALQAVSGCSFGGEWQ